MRDCCQQVGHDTREKPPDPKILRGRCQGEASDAWLGADRLFNCNSRPERRQVRDLWIHFSLFSAYYDTTFSLYNRLITAASMVEKERSRRLSTATLNQVIHEAVTFKPPPRTRGGKRGRVFYCTQVDYLSLVAHFSLLYYYYRQFCRKITGRNPSSDLRLLRE